MGNKEYGSKIKRNIELFSPLPIIFLGLATSVDSNGDPGPSLLTAVTWK